MEMPCPQLEGEEAVISIQQEQLKGEGYQPGSLLLVEGALSHHEGEN
jgi:hypothetical protein